MYTSSLPTPLPPPSPNKSPSKKKFLPAHSIQPIRSGGGRAGTTVSHQYQQHGNNDAQSNHCGHCFTCKWKVHVCAYRLQVLKTDNWIDTFHHSPYKRFSFTLGPSMKLKETFLRFCTEGLWFTLEIHAQCSQRKVDHQIIPDHSSSTPPSNSNSTDYGKGMHIPSTSSLLPYGRTTYWGTSCL